ncbi:hypothetical protein HYC85_004153 [Camellia sinensis]|uniref:Radical SAM core domain-containing protein n=1 Tax=Camellia sinensis TaxID=4442 RepID=A0A7J7HYC8_CAMSI|nr:hypothetical protein HYC85_004153 [Camellia sinensis]
MVKRSRTEAHGLTAPKTGNRAPKWAKWPTAIERWSAGPLPSLRKRNRENRVWFANRDKAKKRVRKSGGRARSRDSETSKQAQHAISPSAQLFLPPKFARTVSDLIDQKTQLEDASGQRWTHRDSLTSFELQHRDGDSLSLSLSVSSSISITHYQPPTMLRSTFTPLLHTIPSKPKPPNLFSHSISISLSQSPPTVRQNASPTVTTTTTTNPLHNLSPTSAYIHLPFCRKRCHYCDFPIVALGSSSTQTNDINNDPRISNYIHLLCREIKATNSQFNHNSPLKTVFFGGGTPSLVPSKLVSLVLETLNLKFGLCLDAEISMEMDPGMFDVVKMKELMGLGVNRVSSGVQAFQDELLKACGRAHGVDEVHEAIGVVGTCGVENWSMDLISSLPHQTPQMWDESLLLTVNARPKHVSVYDLQVERGTKFGIPQVESRAS